LQRPEGTGSGGGSRNRIDHQRLVTTTKMAINMPICIRSIIGIGIISIPLHLALRF